MRGDVDYYIKRFNALREQRMPFEGLWQKLAHYILPQRYNHFAEMGSETPGNLSSKSRLNRTYDSTAEVALDIFASSLVGFLANPATKWFELAPLDNYLLESEGVALWFDDATSKLLTAFNDPHAKFYNALKMCATDIGALGTVGMLIQGGQESLLEFSARSIKELYIAEDASGTVDTVFRKLFMTARQMAQKFGYKNLTSFSKEKFEKTPDELISILHVIEPRDSRDTDSLSNNDYPIASIYIEEKTKTILQSSGFHEMPLPVGRWDVYTNDVYGMAPAVKALADIQMINQMEKAMIVATEKTLNPPMQMPDDGFLGNIDMSPGALNVYRSMSNGRLEPIQSVGNMAITYEMAQAKRNVIREAFYVDQLQLINSPQMTATEVMARTDEKLRLMAPMIGRIQSELLGPIIERSFSILFRKSIEMNFIGAPFVRPPEVLMDRALRVKYVSPMERAQRASEANSIMAFINSVVPLSEINPPILDNIDFDELTRVLHDIQSVPSAILKERKFIAELRKARAKEQEQQAMMMNMSEAANIAKTAGLTE